MGIMNKITEKVASFQEKTITGDDIFSVLKRDHRKVTELFAKIEDTKDINVRRELFILLKTELQSHSEAEESILYSPLRMNSSTGSQISDSFREHNIIRDKLDRLSVVDISQPEWLTVLKELKSCVNHHVMEEEYELFPEAKNIFPEKEWTVMGGRFNEQKRKSATLNKIIR